LAAARIPVVEEKPMPWAPWLSLGVPDPARPESVSPIQPRLDPISTSRRVRKLQVALARPEFAPNQAALQRRGLERGTSIPAPRPGSGFDTPRVFAVLPTLPADLAPATAYGPSNAGLESIAYLRSRCTWQRPEPRGVVQPKLAPFAPPLHAFLCRLRLQPEEWPPSWAPQPQPQAPPPVLNAPPASGVVADAAKRRDFLQVATGFWKHGPRDLRLLLLLIPALLALAFHGALPKVKVSAAETTNGVEQHINTAANGSWSNFKRAVADRAAIALAEDFRHGLDDWSSRGDVATEWSFDSNGFVRPGSLAIYAPTMNLENYQAEFLALIDKQALSWVVRASDFDNYYVIKLVVLKPGPLTTLGLTRYAVIKGVPQDRKDSPVPLTARPDMIYRIHMDVTDETIALSVQGQMVDVWSEPRLKHGGIGFFSARGEESRVRWLQVTHQFDMLGRLCAYLAPYDLSGNTTQPIETSTNSEGSWK
jgi:hypothetical protein